MPSFCKFRCISLGCLCLNKQLKIKYPMNNFLTQTYRSKFAVEQEFVTQLNYQANFDAIKSAPSVTRNQARKIKHHGGGRT